MELGEGVSLDFPSDERRYWTRIFADQNPSDWLNTNSAELHNGNIARMVTTITYPTTREILLLGNAYRYDQLNRLKTSKSSTIALDAVNFAWLNTYTKLYKIAFIYDANGNNITQQRANEMNVPIDNLVYNYQNQRNGLAHERCLLYPNTYSDDIYYSEYTYDSEGRLKSDSLEGIDDIVKRIDGKKKRLCETLIQIS